MIFDGHSKERQTRAPFAILLTTYRRAISDIEQAILHPKDARQERSLRRATAFIREHLGENLKLSRVARIAGFAPGYFSRLFSKSERSTFRDYIQRQRVERAKMLLESTHSKWSASGSWWASARGPDSIWPFARRSAPHRPTIASEIAKSILRNHGHRKAETWTRWPVLRAIDWHTTAESEGSCPDRPTWKDPPMTRFLKLGWVVSFYFWTWVFGGRRRRSERRTGAVESGQGGFFVGDGRVASWAAPPPSAAVDPR